MVWWFVSPTYWYESAAWQRFAGTLRPIYSVLRRAYRPLYPRSTQYFPCPLHVVFEWLRPGYVTRRWHQWDFARERCQRCGVAMDDAARFGIARRCRAARQDAHHGSP